MDNLSYDKKDFRYFINNELPILNILSEGTVKNLRTISNKVLKYIPDHKSYSEWDVAEIMEAFSTSESISELALPNYSSRLKSAIEKFKDYKSGLLSEKDMNNRKKTRCSSNSADLSKQQKTFSLPIPLRKDLILNVSNLPLDLTEEEADKISRIIKSYAIVKET